MNAFALPPSPFARPHPTSFDAAAQVLLTTPTTGPPARAASDPSPMPSPCASPSPPLSSAGLDARSCSPFSDAASDCSTAPSACSPGADECSEPAPTCGASAVARAVAARDAALGQRRRSFARRTARQFQALHPTAHALVLNFDAGASHAVQTTGSRMYAQRGAFDPDGEGDGADAPTVFDSVGFSPGPGQAEEQFDVYLCQSGRFSLGEVKGDERIWGFSSPQWEKVGPYVFFEHLPMVSA